MPPLAHAGGVSRANLRSEREPLVAFVDVVGHVDAVDDQPIDLGIDDDVDKSGMREARTGEIDVAERRTLQIHTPEHGATQVTELELLGHPAIMTLRAHGASSCRGSVPRCPFYPMPVAL